MRQFTRHDRSDILIHWFNAICWLMLLITGIGLISNPALDPLGSGFPTAIRAIFGGGENVLLVHEVTGVTWILGFVVYVLVNARGAMFFLKEIFTVSPQRDMPWMFRKLVLMTAGPKALKAMGQKTDLPPQGYYNMGQKGFAQVAVIGSIIIAFTGIVMLMSDAVFATDQNTLVSWSIALHYLAVGIVFAGLLVHIYMAAISPEERPGLRSMFTGNVPEEYARHHHQLWYETLRKPEEPAQE